MYLDKIEKAEKELAALKAKQAKLDAMKPEESLAYQLHELTCSGNHVDACAWDYEGEKDNYRPGSTRNRWITKSKELLAIEPDVNKIIQLIKISRGI